MKSLVVFSGGLDSTVLLVDRIRRGDVVALTVDYGQRHRREIQSASAITAALGVVHQIIDLRSLGAVLRGSSQTDPSVPVPHGHYTAASMRSTVVPNRNMILLSVAVGVAIAEKAAEVCYAAHNGDHAIYPDCRPSFVTALAEAVRLCDESPPAITAPFVGMSKAHIARLGYEIDAPLGATWSCYEGGALHCGKCGTCVERREAFVMAGVPDPTEYAA